VTFNPNSPPPHTFQQNVLVTGTNFSPNAVAWFTPPCDNLGLRQALSTTRNSAEQIQANILISCAGNYTIQIANPSPGGGLSAPATLNVPSVSAATGTFIILPSVTNPDGSTSTVVTPTDGTADSTTDSGSASSKAIQKKEN
jgi:hypothetical protein